MSDIIVLVTSLTGVIALAAAVLWLIEAARRLIGSHRTWLLFLGVLPFSLGVVVAYLNRAKWSWWELMLVPAAAPIAVALFLLACLVALNPFDALYVAGTALQAGWRRLRRRGPRA